jgi:hemoglobin
MAAIANRFYDLMEADPAYAELRALHTPDLGPVREGWPAFFLAGAAARATGSPLAAA